MKPLFIFPGQGSQSMGMGKDFYDNSDTAKAMIEAASERLGFDFKALLFEENDRLEQTEFTQPAILLVSCIAHALFKEKSSMTPFFALGHSLGEFSALVSVGALNYLDAVALVHQRGLLMKEACAGKDAGMMALLGLQDDQVEALCEEARASGKQVWAANYNSDGQIVIAGSRSDLASLESTFKDAGAKRALLLNMSVASHCPLLTSAQEPLAASLETYMTDSFSTAIISNVTAKPYSSKAEALELLKDQLVKPVRYRHSIEAYESEVDCFIEFGGTVLKGLNRRATKKTTHCIVDMATLEQVVAELS